MIFFNDNIDQPTRSDRIDFARLLTKCKVARALTPDELDATESAFVAAACDTLAEKLHKAREAGATAYIQDKPIVSNPFDVDSRPLEWEQ